MSGPAAQNVKVTSCCLQLYTEELWRDQSNQIPLLLLSCMFLSICLSQTNQSIETRSCHSSAWTSRLNILLSLCKTWTHLNKICIEDNMLRHVKNMSMRLFTFGIDMHYERKVSTPWGSAFGALYANTHKQWNKPEITFFTQRKKSAHFNKFLQYMQPNHVVSHLILWLALVAMVDNASGIL